MGECGKERRNGTIKQNRMLTLLIITGAVYFFLQFVSPLLSPILIAMLFVTMFGPLLKKIQQKIHIHRQVGAVILLLTACAVLVLLIWILFSWAVGSLPKWIGRLDNLERDIRVIVYNCCQLVGRTLGIDSEYLGDTVLKYIEQGFDYFQGEALPGMLMQSLEYMKGFAAFGVFFITFVIAAVLLAKDYDRIMNELLDREEFHVLLEVICGVIRYIATYVKAQLIIMSAIAGVSAPVLALTGIRNGILWGILAGILDALPFIGTGVVLVPIAIARFIYGSIGQAAVCLILYAVTIFLREFLEPRLIGSRIGVPPIAVLVSVYAGIRLFGLWGIIKGPLGFVIIQQVYLSIVRRNPAAGA